MYRAALIIIISLTTGGLSACGQKGPLQRPAPLPPAQSLILPITDSGHHEPISISERRAVS
ncbi:MAG: lipoprotein [Pseudohongiella sp.]|nr:lipoprotein [Pseudohongiella sp.]